MLTRLICRHALIFFLISNLIGAASAGAPAMPHIRGVHIGAYEDTNQQGIKQPFETWLQYLKDNKMEWVGISVAMFNQSISDPEVKVRYRPSGNTGIRTYTYDDADLERLITAIHQTGLKVYLTLAFEDPVGNPWDVPLIDRTPLCNTADYPVNRWLFGQAQLFEDNPAQTCLNPAYWWWNPAHPDHASKVARFFDGYTQVAVKYGALAQRLGVEMYSLGTETEALFRTRDGKDFHFLGHFKPQLTALVSAVRAVYSGLLTYDQSFQVLGHPEWFGGGESFLCLFEDLQLDVVGISAYFRLFDSKPTRALSVEELEKAWKSVFRYQLIPVRRANPNRPVVFLEMGYVNDIGAPAMPPSNIGEIIVPVDANANGIEDGSEQQANLFAAFFNVNRRYGDLVRGVFPWGNYIFKNSELSLNFPYLQTHRDFMLYGRPALQVFKDAYTRWQMEDTESGFSSEGYLLMGDDKKAEIDSKSNPTVASLYSSTIVTKKANPCKY